MDKASDYGPKELYGPETPKNLDALIAKYDKAKAKVETLDQFFRRMNKGFAEGTVTLKEYSERFNHMDLEKFKAMAEGGSQALEKIKARLKSAQFGLEEVTKSFNDGTIGAKEYQVQIDRFEIAKLRAELDLGKINLYEFQEKLLQLPSNANSLGLAMSVGVARFVNESGNMAKGVASLVTKTFDSLGDTFVEFTKTGEFNFAKMTQSILDDLNKIIIKSAIVAPLAQGLLSLVGLGIGAAAGGGGPGTSIGGGPSLGADLNFYPHANGGVMTSMGPMSLQKYSTGGIAKSPQLAMFGEGRRPEAYVPLPDGKNIPVKMDGGGGGINFSQTIIVNSDGSSSTQENTDGGDASKRFADVMKRVALDTINQQMRPGGTLANKYG